MEILVFYVMAYQLQLLALKYRLIRVVEIRGVIVIVPQD
jgi:hypothetical protein